jgi:hypothetical protein
VANLLSSSGAFTFWGCVAQSLRLRGCCHQINLLLVRFSLVLVWGFAALGAISGIADDVLPPRFNFDRYNRMLDHSPFAIATAVALPSEAPDFAKDLYVANAAHSSEGDMVTILSSADQNFKKYLSTREPVDGYSIASIEWSERVGETKVTISKDGKFATLTFNQALLSQAAPSSEVSQNLPLIPPLKMGQASRAHSRGVIQRSSKTAAAPPSNPAPARTPNPEPPKVPSEQELLLEEQQYQQLMQQRMQQRQVPSQQELLSKEQQMQKSGSDHQ